MPSGAVHPNITIAAVRPKKIELVKPTLSGRSLWVTISVG